MLELPSVTLCCVDTLNPALALRALSRSAEGIRFGRSLLLTEKAQDAPGIEIRAIAPLSSRDAYSAFVLKSLLQHIDTPQVLLIQWDGYVISPEAWRDEFLACDYIGAKWFWHDDGHRVGNGGFSLRSRKLLEALQDPRIELAGAEDETICRVFRPLLEREHGVVFASEALADAFAFEAAYPVGKPFGFHGLYNFCRVVPPQELSELTRLFTPAIARSPQLLQLGRNCLALGQWQPAAAIFRRIVEELPEHAEARAGLESAERNLATAAPANRNDPCPCGSGKRYKHCHGASDSSGAKWSQPGSARRLQHALELHQRGEVDAAQPIYLEVLAQDPENPVAEHFLGMVHYHRRRLAEALPLLQRSVAKWPEEPEFHNNYGLALAAADRVDEAVAEHRAALAIKPDHALAWSNLGLALQARNEVGPAIDAFRRALALNPRFAHARWNLALALLLDRQFEEGWREYDARLELAELGGKLHRYAGPRWNGAPVSGKTILLYPEQGLGDALQFARYATLLAASGARCIVHSPDALVPLLATVPGVAEVVRIGAELPRYDAHSPLLSLPRHLGTSAETIPASVPYLSIAEEARAIVASRLGSKNAKRRIGLCWAGNPEHGNDRNRSIALALFAPLFERQDIDWYSLQQGERAMEIASVPAASNLAPLRSDSTLLDTAALIAELDLVVSVDTSIAHLGGALGRPLWVLLPFAPDWRWQLGREDSPWYPSARLFRQPRPGDWGAVLARVAEALRSDGR
jgi:tetratricopeptide (TPR) repeat protein